MRQHLFAAVVALLPALAFATPGRAAEPPPACLAAPDQACLLAWAWLEALAAPGPGEQDPRKLAAQIMTELLEVEEGAAIFALVEAVPDELQRYVWFAIVGKSDASLGSLPQYRQAIETGLTAATGRLVSGDESWLGAWMGLVETAARIGLDEVAHAAFAQGLMSIGDDARKLRAALSVALSLKDYEVVRDLLGRVTWASGSELGSTLKQWWTADHTLAELPEFTEALLGGLWRATEALPSGEGSGVGLWASFVRLAADVGLGDDARRSFAQGLAFLGAQRPDAPGRDRDLEAAITTALALHEYAAVGDLLGRLSPANDRRDRVETLEQWWMADSAIGTVPAFRDAVRTGLRVAAGEVRSGGMAVGNWIRFMRLAGAIGLVAEVQAAYRPGLAYVRTILGDADSGKDWTIWSGIDAALIANDPATARELLGHMTTPHIIEQAEAEIEEAERHPGVPPAWPRQPMPPSEFDLRLSGHDLAAALEAAARSSDYARLALQAAMAGDTATASAALGRFAPETSGGDLTEVGMSCALAAGFAHVLLADDFDVATLAAQAEAWLELHGPRLEIGALMYWWDIGALKMLNGDGQAVLDAATAQGGGPTDRASAVGGSAAVALGIAGSRAWPYMRVALTHVAAVPSSYERASLLELMARLAGAPDTSTSCR